MAYSVMNAFVPAFVNGTQADVGMILNVAKMLAKNVELTAIAIVRRKLNELDSIVHENGCHKRMAFVVQAVQDPEIIQEAQALIHNARDVADVARNLIANPGLQLDQEANPQVIFQQQDLDLNVSMRMLNLLRIYFLTIGKVYILDKDGNEKAAYIDGQKIQQAFRINKQGFINLLQNGLQHLDLIVPHAQKALAISSLAFIQEQAERIKNVEQRAILSQRLAEPNQRNISQESKGLHERCSSAYFEFKTIMLEALGNRRLILLKQHLPKNKIPFLIFLRANDVADRFVPLTEEEVKALNPQEPLYVLQGATNLNREQMVNKLENDVGLFDICMANVATVHQFGVPLDLDKVDQKGKIVQTS